MAQHPEKLHWKEVVPFGLSASQFGMALGFSGRVVDFVKYQRDIVGTEMEFRGNAFTNHGTATEPKSRSLYELLTGSAVIDGGFFVTEDCLLGCSPDGRIFYDDDNNSTPPGPSDDVRRSAEYASPAPVVSVRIPFHSRWKRQTCSPVAALRCGAKRACRLLEIKSPFRSLYDGSKEGCQPFGIPLPYLCQMQGQMAIANVDECDFFVYLDRYACQVVAWRVRRSSEFWQWAKPKLLQVVGWLRDGPPSWLDRTFEFEKFDFRKIVVEPLIFPYDISANKPIIDSRRFSFFDRFPNPYLTIFSGGGGAKQDRILQGLTSAVTRFFFCTADTNEEGGDVKEVKDDDNNVMYCRSIDSPMHSGAIALSWNSLDVGCDTIMGRTMCVVRPCDFNNGRVVCRLYSADGRQEMNDDNTIQVRFFQRDFFHSLQPLEHPITFTGRMTSALRVVK